MEIIIITGGINSGKTTLLQEWVKKEKSQGQFPTGIVALGVFKEGIKTGFEVINLATNESMPLAGSEDGITEGFRVGRFTFSSVGFEFAKNSLLNFKSRGVVFLDEAGPLELDGEGYAPCLKVLLQSDIAKLYICIRQECLKEFSQIFLNSNKFKITCVVPQKSRAVNS